MSHQPTTPETTASATSGAARHQPEGLTAGLVFLLAFAAGLAVANIYYAQPLLNSIADSYRAGVPATSVIIVATQLGYASGLLLIVPLGDAFERRRLIVACVACTAVALVGAALAPTLHVLVALNYLVGLASVSPQLIVPFAATLAAPERRGRVVGTVMGGLLVGILASRSLSGFIGAHLGWQGVYYIGAAAMLLLAAGLRWKLPAQRPQQPVALPELLRSLWPILKGEPVLQRHLLVGAAGFAAFSAFWTALSFYLAARPEHYGSEVAGLFGLIGVAGALAAPIAGRLSDRLPARVVNGVSLGLMVVSFAVMALADWSLGWLIAGVFFMDAGAQGNQISNQSRIYALSPALRNRINAIYMVGFFVGGAVGSVLGSRALQHGGWTGVCATGAGLCLLGLLALFVRTGRRKTQDAR
ncbi:MFS transporter [Termitidicoccus mucosus]|uniref:MFS transporter permease n=1 Tax=Termitidicoccus mucosus TaxID=1184151 RepID=A0A178ID27_9BACT|nr:MFS transporter permease [Opitutaceae bacterium TSB47]